MDGMGVDGLRNVMDADGRSRLSPVDLRVLRMARLDIGLPSALAGRLKPIALPGRETGLERPFPLLLRLAMEDEVLSVAVDDEDPVETIRCGRS